MDSKCISRNAHLCNNFSYCKILIIICLFGLSFFLFVPFSLGSSNISYDFESDTLYNSTYDYFATYSFTNDASGIINDAITGIDLFGGTDSYYSAEVIDNNDGHRKVVECKSNGDNGMSSYWTRDIDNRETGTIELWMKYIDNGVGTFNLYGYNQGGSGIIYLFFNSVGNLFTAYYGNGIGGIITLTTPALPNVWHHIKVSFDSTTDKFSVWLNEILFVDNKNFYNDRVATTVNFFNIRFANGGGLNSLQGYFDAIGESWDTSYSIGDNLVPSSKEINNNMFYDNSYNIIKEKENNGNYKGSYSFENEIGNTQYNIPLVSNIENGINLEVYDNLENHSSILECFRSGGTGNIGWYSNKIGNVTFGIFEFWIYFKHYADHFFYLNENNDVANSINIRWRSDQKLYYYDTTNRYIMNYKINTWYHIRIEFNVNDDWHLYVNLNNTDGGSGYSYRGTPTYVNNFRHIIPTGFDNKYVYFDAIGYSWDINYFTFEQLTVNEPFDTSENILYQNWTTSIVGTGGDIDIYSTYQTKYLRMHTAVATDRTYVYYDYHLIEIVDLSFDFSCSDVSDTMIFLRLINSQSGRNQADLGIDNGYLTYYTDDFNPICHIKNNQWYNIHMIYNDGTELLSVYVNSTLFGTYNYSGWYLPATNTDQLLIQNEYTINALSFDNFTWNNRTFNYLIGDNLFPQLENTGYYQVKSDDFHIESDNSLFDYGDNEPYSDYTELEWYENEVQITDVNNYTIHNTAGGINIVGMFKTNQINGNFLNITIDFEINYMSDSDDYVQIGIRSFLQNYVVHLTILKNGTMQYYTIANGFTNLVHGVYKNIPFKFNIIVQYELDTVFFNYYRNNLYNNSYIFPITTNNQSGFYDLGIQCYEGGSTVIEASVFNIEAFLDGLTLSQGCSVLEYNINYIDTWNYQKDLIIDISCLGYLSISSCSNSFNYYSYTQYRAINYFQSGISSKVCCYDNYISTVNNPILLIFFTESHFSLPTYIKISDIYLEQGSNKHYISLDSQNIDTEQNFFYVSGSRLYFKITPINNDLEYIQASFDINNQIASNYSISYLTSLSGSCESYFRINYTDDSSDIYSLNHYDDTKNYILNQDKIINSFVILLTDNDYFNNQEYTIGSIRSITLIYIPNIEITIITELLMTTLIPIVVIIAPSLLVSLAYKRKATLPMLLLMSIVCLATSLIPTWLFFILMLSLISLFFTVGSENEL